MRKQFKTLILLAVFVVGFAFTGIALAERKYLTSEKFVGARQVPTMYNVTMTDAATEYSQLIAQGSTKVILKLRNPGSAVQVALVSTESGTNYITVPANGSLVFDDVFLSTTTLYFQSPDAAQTAEILVFN